jgi:protein MpaA
MTKWLPCLVLLVLASGLTIAQTSLAKELGTIGSAQGVIAPKDPKADGSSYRYVTVNPRTKPVLTIVERIDMSDGAIDRWWYLRGSYVIPAVGLDGSAGGLSADGNVLALVRFTRAFPPRRAQLAILDTDVYLRHPRRPAQQRPHHAIRRLSLPGHFAYVQAISPNGSKLYLRRYRPHGPGSDDFDLRILDTRSGRLARRPLAVSNDDRPLAGLPLSGAGSPNGRWAYSLYDGDMRLPFLLALDTVTGRVIRVDLPGLERLADPYLLKLRVDEAGRRLAVFPRSPQSGRVPTHTKPLPSVNLKRLTSNHRPPTAVASGLLSFTRTPRRPGNVLLREGVVGRSTEGRAILLRQLGDPAIAARVLVFGCIHGDECAGRRIQPLTNGCPDPHANIFVVPNLDPDGLATGTRLNGRGVDLNRNFPSEWKPIEARGSPQYSGPRPLSEPESRLAARLVERLRPEVTIWFHQHRGGRPLVRAWGQSAPAGRLLAHLARLPFRLIPWPHGTAPNWQNHRFSGTGAYVVELPPGPLSPDLASRLNDAIVRIGRWEALVGED